MYVVQGFRSGECVAPRFKIMLLLCFLVELWRWIYQGPCLVVEKLTHLIWSNSHLGIEWLFLVHDVWQHFKTRLMVSARLSTPPSSFLDFTPSVFMSVMPIQCYTPWFSPCVPMSMPNSLDIARPPPTPSSRLTRRPSGGPPAFRAPHLTLWYPRRFPSPSFPLHMALLQCFLAASNGRYSSIIPPRIRLHTPMTVLCVKWALSSHECRHPTWSKAWSNTAEESRAVKIALSEAEYLRSVTAWWISMISSNLITKHTWLSDYGNRRFK